jgi:hypothetical protein
VAYGLFPDGGANPVALACGHACPIPLRGTGPRAPLRSWQFEAVAMRDGPTEREWRAEIIAMENGEGCAPRLCPLRPGFGAVVEADAFPAAAGLGDVGVVEPEPGGQE